MLSFEDWGPWQRVRAAEPMQTPRRMQLRAIAASASAVGIVLAAVLAVTSRPSATELQPEKQVLAAKKRGAEAQIQSAERLKREARRGQEHEAERDSAAYENRPGANAADGFTQLFDGTPASRFNPESEHATTYNPQAPHSDAYHVARLMGVDTDGSSQLCGRAEVKHEDTWGSICYRGWTQTDAEIFCKTMGLVGGTARYNDGTQPTWDDTAITHKDLKEVSQRAPYGLGTASDAPRQPDALKIWMTEVKCQGNEANVLDCPFGGKPGEGQMSEHVELEWVDYATEDASDCDATSNVGLCCDVSQFCPPRSRWVQDGKDASHEGQIFMSSNSKQKTPDMISNCKCDAGFYVVANHVYSGRCQSCPAGSCSPPGSTRISQCYCLEGFYKAEDGSCSECPLNSCSPRGNDPNATGISGIDRCTCFAGYYLSGGECVMCPEGTTSEEGSQSDGDCSMLCGLPHSSDAGDNAIALVAAAAHVATDDAAMKDALVPYIKAVNDENAADAALTMERAFVPPSPTTYARISTHYYENDMSSIGNHKTHYLDRQSVSCGGVPLNSFHLQTHDVVTNLRYDFKCVGNVVFAAAEGGETALQDDGGGSLHYLDRLYAECPADKAMSQFKYDREGTDSEGKYVYQCMAPSEGSLSGCHVLYTNPADDGGGDAKIEFLDRQHVSCASNEVLQGFGLQRVPDTSNIRYKFKCCRVPGGSDAGYQTRKQAAIARNTAAIARLEAFLAAAQAVQETSKTLYEEQAANRATHMAVLQPLVQVSTSEAKLPAGGFERHLKPLTPDERHKEDIAKVLKSYDAAAGYDADPSVGKLADVVERGSTGPAAFYDEFDQR